MEVATLNPNPVVVSVSKDIPHHFRVDASLPDFDEVSRDEFDSFEIFQLLRHINDPEHPLTLEQLKVVQLEKISVDDEQGTVKVFFTPTIPHCSMATLIGLSLRVKLLRSLPRRFKCDVMISPGTHSSEAAVNKQLNDKERVAAALENANLLRLVNRCLAGSDRQ